MTKKKGPVASALGTLTAEPQKEGKMSKAEAVRQALKENPDLTGADGVAFIKAKFGIDIDSNAFGTYKSITKKAAGGGGGNGKRGRPVGSGKSTATRAVINRGKPSTNGEPTMEDLKQAKHLAETLKTTPQQLLEQVTAIQKFGDASTLVQSLKFWKETTPG